MSTTFTTKVLIVAMNVGLPNTILELMIWMRSKNKRRKLKNWRKTKRSIPTWIITKI